MKRNILILLLFSFLHQYLNAQSTKDIIENEAKLFYKEVYGFSNFSTETLMCEHNVYVVNFINPNSENKKCGFIIVGHLKGSTTILGHSNKGYVKKNDTNLEPLIKRYQQQISQIALQNGILTSNNEKKTEVPPLLGDIEWGQGSPYNQMLPFDTDGQKCVVGCTAVALGQIMKYYNYPSQGQKKNAYMIIDDNRKISSLVDFNNFQIEWPSIKVTYNDNDTLEAIGTIANLLYYTAIAVESKFSSKNTGGNLQKVCNALVNHFDYHQSATVQNLSDHSFKNYSELIYQELESKRPILFGDFNHAFVCDGFSNGFLHLNWGWNGRYNGYFRNSIPNTRIENLCFPHEMITNIFPTTQVDKLSKTINIKKPGTLEEILSIDEKRNITHLTIIGSINEKDMLIIRDMAGANPNTNGLLQYLDLSQVTFLSDKKTPYYYRDLKQDQATITITRTKNGQGSRSIYYNFSNITPQLWEEFIRLNKIVKSNYKLKYVEKDGAYLEGYFLRKNHITRYMFKDCKHLKQIILPNNIKYIEAKSFQNCPYLEAINLPKSLKEIEILTFDECNSLVSIDIDSQNKKYKCLNGVLYDKTMSKLICYPPSLPNDNYIMPESVSEITDYAFLRNQFLRYITLSSNLKVISKGSFWGCNMLHMLKLPTGITTIENEAFAYCYNLVLVQIPKGIEIIGTYVFRDCNNLKDLYVLDKNPIATIKTSFRGLENNKVIELWVPKGSIERYRNSSWGVFNSIREIGVDNNQ